jgi:uncharacterized protein (DUF1800 family)
MVSAPAAHAPIPSPLGEEQRIVHVLNRLAFGPRPEDVARVRQMGISEWMARQLEPERIPDDWLEARLRAYRTLTMSTAELLRDFPPPSPELIARLRAGEMSREEAARLLPPERRPARIVGELQAAKVMRAVWSERQLQEVMVDFWFNHFNVHAGKGAVRWMVSPYEREAIRPHALGRFHDLLLATARHPAMLFYLDNWLSVREGLVIQRGPNAGRRAGLNENYARELLELHTLGVEGGYTQDDVVEVARCFTGWSIDRPREDGHFVFRPAAHDRGPKRVLGLAIPAGGGEGDGLQVIDRLARHPSTARFVSTKLVRRFVSDDPPAALVTRATETFLRTDGDIRSVLRTIVTSEEFFSQAAYRAKVKKPIEVVASAVRALDGKPLDGGPGRGDAGFALARAVARLGEPLYQAQPPTGYPDTAESWVTADSLLARMNFALSLAQSRVPGIAIDTERVLGVVPPRGAEEALGRLSTRVLHGGSISADRGSAGRGAETLAALVLGSPDFQRR